MPPDNKSVTLPEPPPPRPAARDAAIEAAMRRFEGQDDQPAAKPRVAWSRRPQLQLAIAASLVVAVGLPATWIAVRDNGPLPGSVTPVAEPAAHYEAPSPATSEAQPEAQPTRVAPKMTPPAAVPPPQSGASVTNSLPSAPMAEREPAAERDSMFAAAPPPPPTPPPPPPPAPSLVQKSEQATTDRVIVVTGSRISEPNLVDTSGLHSLPKRAEPPNRPYERFLAELQTAVRSDDRDAVIKLIRFPLRMNANGKSRLYRDAQAVRVDYERIFTRRVTEAILAQRADRLVVRDQGRMIGNGEVWFDRTCANQDCSSSGPVRIVAVNP